MPPRPAQPRRHLRDPRLEAGPPAGQPAGVGHARRPLETDGRGWPGAAPAQPEPQGVAAQAEVFSASAVNNHALGQVAPDRSDRLPLRSKDARSSSGLIASLLVHGCLLAASVAWVAAPIELERGGEAVIPVEFILVGPVEQARQEANDEQAARVTTPERESTPEKPPATLPPLDSDEVPASPDASAVRPTEPAPIEPVLQTPALVEDAMQPQARAQEPAAEPLPPLGKAAPPGAPAAERALEPEAISPAPATPPSPEVPAAPAEAFAMRSDAALPAATKPSASPPASAPPPPQGATVNAPPRAVPAKSAVAARRAPERASRPDRAAAAPPEGRTRPAQPALQRGGTGGAAATAGVAEVASWRARVLAHLARHKTYPEWARDQGVEGRASVAFTLDRSGQVTFVSLAGSSGSTILDQATLAMVRRATPFPAMPDGGPASMSFTAAIRYNLR